MPNLSEIQAAFQRHILMQDPAIATHIVGVGQTEIDQRLAVYANAYLARLVEALANEYPALQGVLGQDGFVELCHAYVRAYPSRHYSLRYLGQHLSDYLLQDHPEYLSELARFEWALTTSFDAEDCHVASVEQATAIPAAAWPSLRVRMHPSVNHLILYWNTLARWRSVKDGGLSSVPQRLGEPRSCLIWREGLVSRYRFLDPDEGAAFVTAWAGATFADLCGEMTANVPESEVAQRAAGFLKTWLSSGIVSELLT